MAARRRHTDRTAPAEPARVAYSSPACYAHEFQPRAARRTDGGFEIKRIYDPPAAADGYRVLVDRLWPRGISKQRAALDAWMRELAPSTALRQWFHHEPRRWRDFATRYRAELRAQAGQLETLRRRARGQRVTLLYGARDPLHNQAVVLRAVLRRGRVALS